MSISPQRRRRIFRTHDLRQDGLPQRKIAERLQVSVGTVNADLRALEEDWLGITHAVHDDLLFQQIARLHRRIEQLNQLDPIDAMRDALGPDAQLSVEQIIQLEDRHERRLATAERELRMLLKQLRNPHFSRRRPGDFLDDQLADPEPPQLPEQLPEQAEPDRTELNKPEQSEHAIPSNSRTITPRDAQKKIPAEQREHPFPRDTGRNQPCPCNSGKKRKHCHPDAPPVPNSIGNPNGSRSPPTTAP